MGQQAHTAVVPKTLSPIWDETMTFNFAIDSHYQLDAATLRVEVWDSDLVHDELIGSFDLNLGKVWRNAEHEMYRQWAALCDTTGQQGGCQAPQEETDDCRGLIF